MGQASGLSKSIGFQLLDQKLGLSEMLGASALADQSLLTKLCSCDWDHLMTST